MRITGLILAGGRGTRMGSVDKGLQLLRDKPLVAHVIDGLRPQADALLLNANRNLAQYQAFGVPLCTDENEDFNGPLAGMQAGLRRCETPLLASVPCDSPFLPADLLAGLHEALVREDADIAVAASQPSGILQPHPVFCLLKTHLLGDLDHYLQNGGRRMMEWQERQKMTRVLFPDDAAFRNINTLQDLQNIEAE